MLALLSSIPLKDWLYGGVIAVLLAGFGWYTYHERGIGEQKIEAANAKAVAVQAKHDTDVEAAASAAQTKATEAYNEALAALPDTAPSIVCRAAPAAAPVPSAQSTASGSDGAAVIPEESSVPFDPAPAILRVGQQADAQVTLLQALIRSYQAAGVVAK